MSQNITDVDTFTNPIVIPADSDPADLTYIETMAQGLANRTRYLNERLNESTPPTRTIFIGAMHAQIQVSTTPTPQWSTVVTGSSPTKGYLLGSKNNGALLMFPLTQFVPSGATITQISVVVTPGAARTAQTSSPGDNGRMYIEYYHNRLDTSGPAMTCVGPSHAVEDAGGTSLQLITMSSISELIQADQQAGYSFADYVMVTAGNDAGTNIDLVWGMQVIFSDPGLRNY